jgi:hypothetical protein
MVVAIVSCDPVKCDCIRLNAAGLLLTDSSCFNSNNRNTNVDTPMMQTDKIVTNDRFLVSKSATIYRQAFDATNTGLFVQIKPTMV